MWPEFIPHYSLGGLLKSKAKNSQLLYQTLYCLWLLSYNKKVAEMVSETKVIPYIVDVLRTVPKEKVARMGLATLRVLYLFAVLTTSESDRNFDKQ